MKTRASSTPTRSRWISIRFSSARSSSPSGRRRNSACHVLNIGPIRPAKKHGSCQHGLAKIVVETGCRLASAVSGKGRSVQLWKELRSGPEVFDVLQVPDELSELGDLVAREPDHQCRRVVEVTALAFAVTAEDRHCVLVT